jgi:RNA polymerase sigma-54 factor
MALTQKLLIRQSQALVMTPQLMQAIKLLQLSNLDLTAYVENELERNPLLERTAEGGEGPAGDNGIDLAAAGAAVTPDGEAPPADWIGQELEASRSAIEERLDTGMENVFPDDAPTGPAEQRPHSAEPAAYSEWSGVGAGGREGGDYNLEAFVTAETTLASHLSDQLLLAVHDPVQRMIGQHLIDLVDDSGYLSADFAAVAEKLGAPESEVAAVLAIVQGFEPSGVAARNLAECLAIQLKELDRFDPAMQILVGHLDLLARRDLSGLKKICGVDDADLADMISEIRALNPKPGLAFGSTMVQPMVPDVFVRQASDGNYAIELNSDTLPKVLVDQSYYAVVSKNTKNDAEKSYLNECLQTATWLVRALDQRAKTILKVSTEIVRQQDGFFAHGVRHLRPLNLKTVADAIGMHESTVSRVTANKYMATSRGIFELKYFFTSSIASADGGEAHSAEAVRHRIRQLIDDETPDEVLSDDTIVERLRTAGIDIARRTVAKYREAMKIPSSVQRRREKQDAVG